MEANDKRPHVFEDFAARCFHKHFEKGPMDCGINETIDFSSVGKIEISGGSAEYTLNVSFGE